MVAAVRSDIYRLAVREIPCTLNVHGVVGCPTSQSMLVHNDMLSLNKGTGYKSEDIGAAGCAGCHHEVGPGTRLTRDEKQYYTMRGTIRTIAELIRRGILVLVKPKKGVSTC